MKITFEIFREDHLPLLIQWLRTPHVKEYWSEPGDEIELRRKYLEKPKGRGIQPHIILLNGRAMGFIQSYQASQVASRRWLVAEYGFEYFRD